VAPQQEMAVPVGCWYLACSAVRCSAVRERYSVVGRLEELLGKESHSARPLVHPSVRLSLLSGAPDDDE